MNTLLIDNYDSFTYNLYQYLAACNGCAPIVIRNDEMDWEGVQQLEFDNIVISPGPGRPQRPADLGVTTQVLQHSDVPVLGVCLGHQAIGHFCGATVDLAARPMHGRLDKVTHSAFDLFRGVPNPFEAVRYHSLAVTHLPPELQPCAWTSDGTLMALRHTSRPWWGVQFHPESICSEYGARLLRNFSDLTREWQLRRHRAASDRARATPRANDALTLHARCLDSYPDPQDAFIQMFAHSNASFWLDSSQRDAQRARFSFMGDDAGPNAQLISYRSRARQLEVRQGTTTEVREQSVFDFLREETPRRSPGGPALPFEFRGGYVGYFGYELKGELEGEHGADAPTPDAQWILADRFIAFDHLEQRTWIVCLDRAPISAVNDAWINDAQRLLSRLASSSPPARNDAATALAALAWRVDLPAYRDLVLRCQEEILQGETYEVCLTNQLCGSGGIAGLDVYRLLRARNPAPYAAYLKTPEVMVLCASPELFVQIAPDRTVDSRPIKGTARRGATEAEDSEIAQRLLADEKTRSENLMIVDLLRNDMNRVCELGSVHVPGLFEIESYATVHQMVSTIRGRLRDDLTAVDCIRSMFPGGSMTGAPKIRTMKILDGLERSARGIYSGSIGYLSFDGSAKLNIVIRTIVCANDGVSIGSGGAIVALSDPDDEVGEIVLKARAQWDALREAGAPLGPIAEGKRPNAQP
ncbi:MAG: pab [Variovorax sp.]|nr:pab [Variovorax sp.]